MNNEQEHANQIRQPMESVNLYCPICGQIDRIERVTSVFYGGISSSRSQGRVISNGVGYAFGLMNHSGTPVVMHTEGKIEMSGSSQTAISKMFSPPLSPAATSTKKLLLPWILILSISFSCFITSCAVILNVFPLGSLNLIGTLITVAIPILLVILCIFSLLRLTKNLQKVKALLAIELPRWEQKMTNWSSMYYCSRDTIVFLPDSGRYAQANAIDELL